MLSCRMPHFVCVYVSLCNKFKTTDCKENNEEQINFSGRFKGCFFGLLLILAGTLFLAFNFGWIDPASRSVVFSWSVLLVLFWLILASL